MKPNELEAAADDLKHTLGLLIRRLRSTSTSEQRQLSSTQKSVLARLQENGPMTSADLARAESVKPQSMSTAISQLEDLGLVEKKPRKDDGRQIDIKVTPKAIAMRKTNRVAMLSWLSQSISRLSKDDQATLFEAVKIIKRMVNA